MWTFNGTRIFVSDKTESAKQIIARLQPIKGETILEVFGYESPVVKIGGLVVGEADKTALLDLRKSGLAYTLSGYGIDYGDYYVSSISIKQRPTVSQTIRTDLDCDAPVFDVDLELFI